ncbi:Fe-Mn family superoxide dismutase [Streptomyces violascens]
MARSRRKPAAVTTFSSGWAWLVKKADGSLDVISTSNTHPTDHCR